MTYFELSPHNGQKSFYGKAVVAVHQQRYTLQSITVGQAKEMLQNAISN